MSITKCNGAGGCPAASHFSCVAKKSNQKKANRRRCPSGSRKTSIQNGKRKNSPDKAGLKQFSFLIRFELKFCGSVEAEIKAYCDDRASLI